MISLLDSGEYRMIETKSNAKALELNESAYAWFYAKGIGEILVSSHNELETDTILSVGKFKLYDVKNEPGITDLAHLELEVGKDSWQSYLLLTGLPSEDKLQSRIVSSKDHITGNKKYFMRIRDQSKLLKHLLRAGLKEGKGGKRLSRVR